MRAAIATHMLQSMTTAPHVTAVFEADFSAIMRHRDAHKAKLAAEGITLSYTAYIVSACVTAMRAVPEVNSRWHDDALEVFDDINIGVGTALGDKGLIVPVIHQAQHLSLAGIAAKLQDLTSRARSNTLNAADVRGGTFTISNHGVSGSLVAAPIIINQPQSAILGIGKLEKRVVVREVDGVDTIQIRPMAYVSLTIDHRALDGHQTNTWLNHFVQTLESWPQ
jgi:2-oxoglutarate dehydrogenase E2 component (dihydrolipoamide succinyltransferase)